jgi:cytochrome c oxidase subunit 2
MTARPAIAGGAGRRCVAAAGPLLAGCAGAHHVLDPAGPQAAHIADDWWVLLAICTAVYVLVLLVLVAAIVRRRRGAAAEDPIAADPHGDALRGQVVAGAVALTIVLLFVLAATSFLTGRALSSVPPGDQPVTIKVTGHQWWWELEYQADMPSNIVTTANEMHVPLGRPVQLQLTSSDVIHSFWAPNIDGKRDLIPGHINTIAFSVDRAGTYRAPCAEFCGLEHALMHLLVVAEPAAQFDAWLAHERASAVQPGSDAAARGQRVFMTAQCSMCHRVAGTDAGGTVAPDLTHLASRRTLAAGTLPNTRGHLAGWIVDPQRVKPGSHMPMNRLTPDDLQSLLDYLQELR